MQHSLLYFAGAEDRANSPLWTGCTDVDSVLGLLHHVEMDDAASIFKFEVRRMVRFCICTYSIVFWKKTGRKSDADSEAGASSEPMGTVDQ
jgi:hypothetical protein